MALELQKVPSDLHGSTLREVKELIKATNVKNQRLEQQRKLAEQQNSRNNRGRRR